MIPTDATVETRFTKEVLRRATEGCATPAARYTAKFGQVGYPMWDEVAAAVFRDPATVTQSGRLAMDVEIGHGATYGSTLSWPAGGGPGLGEPDVTVVRSIDVARLEAMFVEEVRRPPTTP